MLHWMYDVPTLLFCLIVVCASVLFGVGGRIVTRPLLRRIVGPPPGINDVAGTMIQAAGAFYGITLGLIAVGAWQTYGEVDERVAREAAALGALYRDVSVLPQPLRTELQGSLREYANFEIHTAWPAMRRGEIPTGGNAILDRFEDRLTAFEPDAEHDRLVTRQSFAQFNMLVEARRLRLQAVTDGMPSAVWAVVVAGGIAMLMLCWLMVHERQRAVNLAVGLLSVLIGLIIYLTAAMDSPFRGDLCIGPEAIMLVRDQLMD